ncbi:MAG: VWA domain-containing protein [Spirochaetota bacterium]|nr:VWA domain-containing protein [Spirochaetota bacterium]
MYNFTQFKGLKQISWKNLRPGMIVIGSFSINDEIPYELRGFPVLTNDLLNELHNKYKLNPDKPFYIAETLPGIDPYDLSKDLKDTITKVKKLNEFRNKYKKMKEEALESIGMDINTDIHILNTDNVEREYLIKDKYSSFSLPYEAGLPNDLNVPSFFNNNNLEVTLSDILTNKVKNKFNLPEDKEVQLHLVVDYSASMGSQKMTIVLSVLHSFNHFVSEFLLNTKINYYVFSNECKRVDFPLSGKEIKRKDTCYANFMKKILHFKNPDMYNKVILFTDGEPSDHSQALVMAEKFKKYKIDYTQIVFNIKEDLKYAVEGADPKDLKDGYYFGNYENVKRIERSDEDVEKISKGIYNKFTEIANVSGGNQILLLVDILSNIIAVECYDRYLGLLTLASDVLDKRNNDKPYIIKW